MADRQGLAKPQEVAEFTQYSTAGLAQLRYRGRGPNFVKIGRQIRYRWEDVEVWVNSQTRSRTDDRSAS